MGGLTVADCAAGNDLFASAHLRVPGWSCASEMEYTFGRCWH